MSQTWRKYWGLKREAQPPCPLPGPEKIKADLPNLTSSFDFALYHRL
jgi:hypothetical protein